MRFSVLIYLSFLLCLSTYSYANVAVTAGDCDGAVFGMPGMFDSQHALVITNGHCIGLGNYDGFYPDYGETFKDYSVANSLFLQSKNGVHGTEYKYNKIVFATMTVADLAIIELNVTYKEIRGAGIKIYSLAKVLPPPDMTLVFDSFNRNTRSVCTVDQTVSTLREGPWMWKNSIRMKSEPKCDFQHGESGSAGVEPISGLIYGLAQTGYDGGPACSLNNACEIETKNGRISVRKSAKYIVPTAFLYSCYNEKVAAFDFDLKSCYMNLPMQ